MKDRDAPFQRIKGLKEKRIATARGIANPNLLQAHTPAFRQTEPGILDIDVILFHRVRLEQGNESFIGQLAHGFIDDERSEVGRGPSTSTCISSRKS